MKKKLMIITGSVLALGIAFSAGIYTKATTDWQTNAINNSYSELLDTANKTTTDLTKNTDQDINDKISSAISTSVDQQQADLQKLLDEYYQMKLDGLTDTPEYKALEDQIAQIKQNVYEAYRKQIDEAFANAQ